MLRKLIALKLRVISTLVLEKYKPKIVAITGSVGKSTTKEVIFYLLRQKFFVWKSEKNLNTEIGVPLSILGITDEPGRNIIKWFRVFSKGIGLILFTKKYPQILVLEMAAEFPGDLEYLTSFVRPDVSVVTNVGISHMEFFKTHDAIRREKGALVRALSADGVAILNRDDEGATALTNEAKCKVITFGLTEGDFNLSILTVDKTWPKPVAYSSLAAAAVASVFHIPTSDVGISLREFKGLPGRLQKIEGVNGSIIIDDTYNSAPDSAIAALEFLKSFPGKRKIVVFGRMAELGDETEPGHRKVGKVVADLGIDFLFVKNNEALFIAEEAKAGDLSIERVIVFSGAPDAIKLLTRELKPGDVVLVKASRVDKFEEIVKGIMKV